MIYKVRANPPHLNIIYNRNRFSSLRLNKFFLGVFFITEFGVLDIKMHNNINGKYKYRNNNNNGKGGDGGTDSGRRYDTHIHRAKHKHHRHITAIACNPFIKYILPSRIPNA
jgi:hypothetical protein